MKRVLPLLATANFAAASAGMIIAGILQMIAEDLHWSPARAGQLITVYALGFALGAPLLGAALRNRCRKQIVVAGLCLVALGSLASALPGRDGWLEASRLVVAAGAAMVVPSVSAIAAYLFPQDRPGALATVLAGMTAAVVLGMPLGTLLAGALSWHAPLVAAAVAATAAAALVKWALPGGIVVPPVPLSAWAKLLADRSTYPLLATAVCALAATFCLYAYIAPFLDAMLGSGAQQLAWLLFWFGLTSLAANAIVGRVTRAVGPQRLLFASLAGLVITLALIGLAEQRLWLIVALFATWSVCGTFFGTLQQARVVDAAPALGPAMLALNTSAIFVGQAIGTGIGGLLIDSAGLRALPWGSVTLGVLAIATVAMSRPGQRA